MAKCQRQSGSNVMRRPGAMPAKQYLQTGGMPHPYEHKLRLRAMAPSPYCRNTAMERALTVTNFQLTPKTTFEMERPLTQGNPKLVVINTSFKSTFHERRPSRKRIPTFPDLSTDAAIKRKSNISRLTNSSLTATQRMHSGNSTLRRNLGSASNKLNFGAEHSGNNREHSGNSDKRLTPRQSNTFAAYAKYNDIVTATRSREKASESPITGHNNDLSSLMPLRGDGFERRLSSEKHTWISDWVTSTSAALKLDEVIRDETPVSNSALSVIKEN